MVRKLREVPTDSLTPPEGWENNLDTAVVSQIAESLKHEGLREPIVCVHDRNLGPLIVHGVHRWAAALEAGIEKVECVFEPKSTHPVRHEAKVLAENLHRRHFGQAELRGMLVRIVELRTEEIDQGVSREDSDALRRVKKNTEQGDHGFGSDKPKRGPKPSAKTQAIREVAQEWGSSEDSVRMAVERHRRAGEKTTATASEKDALEQRLDKLSKYYRRCVAILDYMVKSEGAARGLLLADALRLLGQSYGKIQKARDVAK